MIKAPTQPKRTQLPTQKTLRQKEYRRFRYFIRKAQLAIVHCNQLGIPTSKTVDLIGTADELLAHLKRDDYFR
jgi:hypothetical protein